MFRYKINVLKELKNAGYNTTRLRKENILAQASIQDIRKGKVVGINSLDVICGILGCQVGMIIEHVKNT